MHQVGVLPDNLTIRVEATEGFVDVEDFVSIVNDTVSLLGSICRNIGCRSPRPVRWRVSGVTSDGPLTMTVSGNLEPADQSRVIGGALQGLRHLENQAPGSPALFSFETLEYARQLVRPLNDGVSRLTLWSGAEEPISPTQRVAAQANELLPRAHDEIGTLEGRLEMAQAHNEQAFYIRDVFTGSRVECRFPDDLKADALAARGRRVAVQGTICYNSLDVPVGVLASEVQQLRERHELPQFKELEELDLQCDGDPVEAVQRLWHGG